MKNVRARVLKKTAVEARVEELLERMTPDEKIGQLVQFGTSIYSEDDALLDRAKAMIRAGRVGSFLSIFGAEKTNAAQKIAVEESRLGIPIIFGLDVIHGLRTASPVPLGEVASWDPAAVEACAAGAAREARASGVHWTFAPMVDIARDPRWGRVAEGAGEDTWLGCAMARARVRGFQGPDMSSPDRVAACAKHFAAYGAAEGGRDYNSVDMSERTFHEVYLPPFAAALDEGCATVMCAFNDFNGTPCSGSRYLLTEILRGELGFDGFVVSDAMSVQEMIAHGFAADRPDAGAKALTAGVDMDMGSSIYFDDMAKLVDDGRVSTDTVDEAVRRILRIKFELGLFENPYADPAREKEMILHPDHRAAARDLARKSMVLLKNDAGLLPLKKDMKKVAVIGPLADNQYDSLGTWAVFSDPKDVLTARSGIKTALPGTDVVFESGCGLEAPLENGMDNAIKAAADADAVILVVGEGQDMSGEAHSRADISMPAVQRELTAAVIKANPNTVVVIMAGRQLAIPELAATAPALLYAWHPGTETGPALADVLFGAHNPSGRLPVTFPHSTGQLPLYYNHFSTGRPADPDIRWCSKYIDAPIDPLYPFGFGLGYTTFEYADLRLSTDIIAADGTLEVSATVTNNGSTAGTETMQLYIQDVAASLVRPVRELRGFRQVTLEPGASAAVTFTLGPDELGMYDAALNWIVEPGEFNVWIGPHSREGLKGTFTVK